jgi:hypothetical protein
MDAINKPPSHHIEDVLSKTVFFLKPWLSLRQKKRDKREDKKLQKQKNLDRVWLMMKNMFDIKMLIRQLKFIDLFLPS